MNEWMNETVKVETKPCPLCLMGEGKESKYFYIFQNNIFENIQNGKEPTLQ